MVLEEKSVLFIATQKGFYNDKIIFEGEMFYAPEKINVSCDGNQSLFLLSPLHLGQKK